MGLIPVLGRSPEGGKWQPTPVFLPEKACGQRSLAGYSPWDRKEWNMTEQVTDTSKEKGLFVFRRPTPSGFHGRVFKGYIWDEGFNSWTFF